METITSARNPKILSFLELQSKSKTRRETGLFVVEGKRELEHCLAAGYLAHTVFICPEIFGDPSSLLSLLPHADKTPSVFYVSSNVYDKIAYRGGTEGVVAQIHSKNLTFRDIDCIFSSGHAPLIAVLESVEKPGNLGAILRSADAAGIDAILVCDPLTDLYNPNLIRSSIGSAFTVPVVACTSEDAISWLRFHEFSILTAQLQDSHLYYDTDMTGPTAIVMGTESTGLSDMWREAATAHIRIPMLGRLDSLNVSVSAAILLYEAVRQRRCGN